MCNTTTKSTMNAHSAFLTFNTWPTFCTKCTMVGLKECTELHPIQSAKNAMENGWLKITLTLLTQLKVLMPTRNSLRKMLKFLPMDSLMLHTEIIMPANLEKFTMKSIPSAKNMIVKTTCIKMLNKTCSHWLEESNNYSQFYFLLILKLMLKPLL